MTDAPLPSSRGRFSDYYALPRPPWDIGRPQRAFVEHEDAIGGRVLEEERHGANAGAVRAAGGGTVTGQAVAAAAYADEDHVEENRRLYARKFDLADQIVGDRYGYERPAGGATRARCRPVARARFQYST